MLCQLIAPVDPPRCVCASPYRRAPEEFRVSQWQLVVDLAFSKVPSTLQAKPWPPQGCRVPIIKYCPRTREIIQTYCTENETELILKIARHTVLMSLSSNTASIRGQESINIFDAQLILKVARDEDMMFQVSNTAQKECDFSHFDHKNCRKYYCIIMQYIQYRRRFIQVSGFHISDSVLGLLYTSN